MKNNKKVIRGKNIDKLYRKVEPYYLMQLARS